MEDYVQVLEKEVNIDFCRSMNRIIFEKTIDGDPFTFAFVTVPEMLRMEVPEKGYFFTNFISIHSVIMLRMEVPEKGYFFTNFISIHSVIHIVKYLL